MAALDDLSDREREVANQLLAGKSNKQIALALHITERTVEFHLKNIFDKFQVSSRVELVLKLRKSTVADEGKVAENRPRFNLPVGAAAWKAAVSKMSKEISMDNVFNSQPRGDGNPLTFFESIRDCFAKYAEFTGKASRSELWWFLLFITLAASALAYLSETAASIFLIAVLLPLLAVGARRLHDIGKSAWWLLYLLVPVGGIILLGILWAQPPTGVLSEDTQTPS